ncbi:hypothetical protein GW17_00046145 [Ensete ventricosum]|nr:hypothetical protein GW17_00046145 [Ensete ventricosum]
MLTRRPYANPVALRRPHPDLVQSPQGNRYDPLNQGRPNKIHGLPTSDDGRLTLVCAEIAFGRAGERNPILGHQCSLVEGEVLCILVLL